MKKISLLLLCSIFLTLTACKEDYPDLDEGLYAEIKTNHGTVVSELYFKDTPMTVASFVSLAEGNNPMVEDQYKEKKFYNGLVFHRVIKDFMIQGGDPTGTGSGGPGYKFPNEIVDSLRHNSSGILSMANSGPDTNGSQFFITLKETPWLDGMHTVFGKVVKGQDVVDKIGAVETGDQDRPVEDVTIQEVNIIRKGNAAEKFDAPQVLKEKLQSFKDEAEAREKKMSEAREANKQRFEELKPQAKELESGLKIAFLEQGDGEKPNTGDTVLVNYEGYLANGELFDTNKEDVAAAADILNPRRKEMGGYAPYPMQYSPDAPMIPGFKEGIQQLKVGDEAVIFIPAHLAYGDRGMPPVIPPNSDLVFKIKLMDIKE